MATTYTKRMLAERIRTHMVNNFVSDDFSISDEELILYIDSAAASSLVGSVMGMYKVKGVMETPEGYLVNTQLDPLIKNATTNEWKTTLPQSPLSLSLGLSLSSVYFYDDTYGISQPVYLVSGRRSSFRDFMPKADGVYGRVLGTTLLVKASDGSSLVGLNLCVDMVGTRTQNPNDTMTLPDDVLDLIFSKVVAACKDRLGMPQDIIKDNLPSGNKSS